MENPQEEKDWTLSQIADYLEQVMEKADAHQEIAKLKVLFYKKQEAVSMELRQAWVDAGNDIAQFTQTFEEEIRFKDLLNRYKQIRAREMEAEELMQQRAYEIKNEVIEKLRALLSQAEHGDVDVDVLFPQVHDLQQCWKDAGQVVRNKYNELVREYQALMDQFYDEVKISHELRDYDFKKNLEAKTSLCEQAEALVVEAGVDAAFQELQQLHAQWKELGPVAREYREPLWERFKAASDTINKRHAAYYQEKRAAEEVNLVKKTALCEQVEALQAPEPPSFKAWDEITRQVMDLQAEWKNTGFAPKKDNARIYDRFRSACDALFHAKSAFYKETKGILSANQARKIALCEQAEALKDSQDWKETAAKLVQLQQEWKNIGPVAKKVSDQLWNRFTTACDAFFTARNAAQDSVKNEQTENLKKKRAVVEEIATYAGEKQEELKELISSYNEIGYVPFKEKDKLYQQFKEAVDAQYRRLKVGATDMLEEKPLALLIKDRDRLLRAYEAAKADLAVRERNISFLNTNPKNPSPLLAGMQKQLDKLRDEMEGLKQKITMLEERIHAQ